MEKMKEVSVKGAFIPRAKLKESGFVDQEEATVYAMPGAVIVLPKQMTAMPMIHAVESLSKLSTELLLELADACGLCDGCDEGDGKRGGCLFGTPVDIHLPEKLLEEAGIPENSKLCAYPNEEEKTIQIAMADDGHDLSDISPDTLELLVSLGICIGELGALMHLDEVIHDA